MLLKFAQNVCEISKRTVHAVRLAGDNFMDFTLTDQLHRFLKNVAVYISARKTVVRNRHCFSVSFVGLDYRLTKSREYRFPGFRFPPQRVI